MARRKKDFYPVVSKTNDIIESRSTLGLNAQKLTLACISFLDSKKQKEFGQTKVKGVDLYKLMGGKGANLKNWRTELRNAFDDIGSNPIWVKSVINGLWNKTQVHWVQFPVINEGDEYVYFTFHPELKPYLLEVNRVNLDKETGKRIGFTQYELRNIINLNSPTSIRIYELLKQYEPLKERTVEFDLFRDMVGSKTKDRYSIFAIRYLKPAQKELSEKTDITFEYEGVKTGRKITKILFKPIQTNKKAKQPKRKTPKRDLKPSHSVLSDNTTQSINEGKKSNTPPLKRLNVIDDKIERLKVRFSELELSKWQGDKLIKELQIDIDGVGLSKNGYTIWKLINEVKQMKNDKLIKISVGGFFVKKVSQLFGIEL